MKKSFTLAALLLVLSTGLFAATPVKTVVNNDDVTNTIVVQALRTSLGFGVSLHNLVNGSVTITDKDSNQILFDKLAKGKKVEKAYNLTELEEGNYTVTVNANQVTVTKKLYVYQEYGQKSYLFLQ